MVSRLINSRYEILERVGEGTLFQVMKTRDKLLGRVVAVKTVLPVYSDDQAISQALRKSAGGQAEMDHPNIARILDVSIDEDGPLIVTEFVRGINLKDRIRRISPFTLSVAVDFAISIGEALQYAHSQGFCHGDLRPHNVVISPEGALKVTDFGLSPVYAANESAWDAHLERAQPYRAPELSASASSVTGDLYALGVVLFEMLTGALPQGGNNSDSNQYGPSNLGRTFGGEMVPSPRSLNPGVPRSLEGIVMKAMQPRPGDRYVAAGDMLNDLKSVRDALRFGKPLSWSPLETAPESAPEPLPAARGQYRFAGTDTQSEAIPEPVARLGAARMSTTSAADDRISPFVKLALGTVTVLLIVVLIVGAAIWMATFTKPPDQTIPSLIGMKLPDAQAVAAKADVHLVEHDDYNEKMEPGVIFRSDWPPGRPVRPGRNINVWVSKGSRMVWVPNLVGSYKDDAEKKLKDNGLILGEVDRQFSKDVALDHVISQNPRAGKRVNRDLAINLQISDGPKPGDENVFGQPPAGQQNPTGDNGDTGQTDNQAAAPDPYANESRPFNLAVTIKSDHRGLRRVRVEYDDAQGTHTPIDEYHNEGEEVKQRVEVYGRRITVRIYYGEEAVPVSEKTITLPAPRRH